MKKHSQKFLTDSVRSLTGGEVTLRESIQVSELWWKPFKTPHRQDVELLSSTVYVFEIKRSRDEVMNGETAIKWMGEKGVAYVWNYEKNGRSYYTRVFHHPGRGITNAESAVKSCVVQGRPWN